MSEKYKTTLDFKTCGWNDPEGISCCFQTLHQSTGSCKKHILKSSSRFANSINSAGSRLLGFHYLLLAREGFLCEGTASPCV